MTGGETAVAAGFVLYLAVTLVIGAVAYRQTRDLSDYILGGRRLNRWVAALSAQASDMSGWLLLGLPGLAYATGLQSLWLVAGLLAGVYLNWRLVAGRLRLYTEAAGNALTLPDYLERRFGERGQALRVVSAVFILVFFLFYTASGLVAGGKLFNAVFDLPYAWAVLAGASAIVIYTLFGGFLAVSWTDTVQGSLMFAALVAVPVAGVVALGGWVPAIAGVHDLNPALLDAWTDPSGAPLSAIAGVSLLAWGLGYFGQPHILARFMAVRGIGEVGPARRIAVGWAAIVMAGAVVVGLLGLDLVHPPLQGADHEKVFIHLVRLLFHPLVAGIWLAAILAAIMSTADSQLLVAASVVSEDLYRGLIRPDAGQRALVWLGRGAVLAIALLAVALAMDPESRVLEMVGYAWAGLGAAFGPVVVLSLFWSRMSASGCLAGMLAGGVTVIVWRNLHGGVFEVYEMLPGVALSTLAIIAVSLYSRPPAPAVLERFESVAGGR